MDQPCSARVTQREDVEDVSVLGGAMSRVEHNYVATFSWMYPANSFIMHSNFSERTSSIKLEMVRIVGPGAWRLDS